MMVIQPFGEVDADILSQLKSGLRGLGDTTVNPPLPIPEDSYDPGRDQYLVTQFLMALEPIEGSRVLGVVDKDLFAPELNFIFGKARILAKDCIIAIPRLKEGGSWNMFMDRVLKEAIHELGHTFGLRHCQDRRCVMHFSNCLHDTDVKGRVYCHSCQRWLRENMDVIQRGRY